ncbi:hypothetical protein [Streptomyces sp. NPDC056468]|uniref:hypothetical protein n=1 Tax=unclassified Streptomyces TaxID=2593676 RepID=UPI00367640EC
MVFSRFLGAGRGVTDRAGTPLGRPGHCAEWPGAENGRAAAPSFGTDGGVPYMLIEAGERLAGAIAVARG